MTFEARLIYALILVASVAIAWRLVRHRQQRLPLSTKQRWSLAMGAFLGAMIGSKIPYLGEQGWGAFFNGVVWFSDGKTILGGIAGGYIAVEFTKWLLRIRIRTGDSFALPVAVAVAVGRVGCFFIGCCFGRETTLPWGVRFEFAHDPPGIFRHPTQLYEVIFHLGAAVWLLVADRQRWMLGNQLKAYLMCYLIYRFFSEWLRPESVLLLDLTFYQIVCVVLFSLLVMLWIRDGNDREEETKSVEEKNRQEMRPT